MVRSYQITFLISTISLCLAATESMAIPKASTIPTTPLAQCPYVSDTIVIDGDVNEKAWDDAPLLAPFQLIENGLYPTVRTEARVLYNKKFLYVSYLCSEPDMKSIRPNCKTRDGNLWQSDVLEIFIKPPGSEDYYQLALNTDAVQADFKNGDRSWNGKWQAAVKRLDDRWTVEVAIPFSDLGFSPKTGETIGFNVTRYRKKGYQWCSWSQTGESFKNVSRFGELRFVRLADIVWRVDDIEKGILRDITVKVFATPAGPSREFYAIAVPYEKNKPAGRSRFRFQTKPDFTDGPQIIHIPVRLPVNTDAPGVQVIIANRDGKILSRSGQLPVKLLKKNKFILQKLSRKYNLLTTKGVPARFSNRIGQWTNQLEYLKGHLNDDKSLKKLFHELSLANLVSRLSAELQKADVLPFVLPVFSVATENDIPESPRVVGLPLRVTACRGESEPASVYLLALKKLRNVTLTIEDLHSGGNVLSAESVNVWLLKNWYQSGTGSGKTDTPVFVPELLLKDDSIITVDHVKQRNILHFDPWYGPIVPETLKPVSIPAETNRQFWLRVDIPKDQPAGKYSGELIIKSEGKRIAKIPMDVTVLPVTLEDSNATFGAYSHYEYRPGAEKWKKARSGPYIRVNETFYRNLLKMCVRYGMNSLMIQEGIIIGKSKQPVPAKTEYLRKAFELRRKYGLTKTTIYHGFNWSSTKEAGGTIWYAPLKELRRRDSTIVKHLFAGLRELKKVYNDFKKDFPDFYVYTVDEPEGSPNYRAPAAKIINRWVHQAGFKTAEAAADPHLSGLDLMIQGGSGLPNVRHAPSHRLIYWHPREAPLYDRRFTGVIIWYCGYLGTYPYVLASDFGGLWDDFDKKEGGRPERFIYDGRDRPIPTIQFEAYREGVDDYKYLEMIQRRCKKLHGKRLNGGEQKIVQKAIKLIDNLPDWFHADQPESYEKLRRHSQKLLIQLESLVQKYR